MTSKLLLVGWRTADWKILEKLLKAGRAPNLRKLVDGGVSGALTTGSDHVPAAFWATLATGRRPLGHAVTSPVALDGAKGFPRPAALSLDRKAPALWDILGANGLKTNLVCWEASHPAEAIDGVMLSDYYQLLDPATGQYLPLKKEAVYPPLLRHVLADLRVTTDKLDPQHVLGVAPKDLKKHPEAQHLMELLAASASVSTAAVAMMANAEWNLTAVHFDALGSFHERFPARPDLGGEEAAPAPQPLDDALENAYAYHDMLLGALLEAAGDDCAVMLLAAGPGAADGLLVIHGGGALAGENVYGARAVDVCPTLLAMFGLTAPPDLDGESLVPAFAPGALATPAKRRGGKLPPHHPLGPFAKTDADRLLQNLARRPGLERLAAKGPALAAEVAYLKTLHHAAAEMDAGNASKAVKELEALCQANPDRRDAALRLADCLLCAGDAPAARRALDALGDADADGRTMRFHGLLALAEGDGDTALDRLRAAEKLCPPDPALRLGVADALVATGNFTAAEMALRKTLALDPDSPKAHLAMAKLLFHKKQFAAALAAAQTAAGLDHRLAAAYLLMAKASTRLKKPGDTRQCLETCLKHVPGHKETLATLDKIRASAGGI